MKRIAPLLVGGLLLLTGCAEDRADRALTVDEPSQPEAVEAPKPEGSPPAAAPEDAAGEPLTQQQVEAALLTVQDMPTGWTTDVAADEGDSEDSTEPPECAQLFEALADRQDSVAEAEASFTAGDFGPFLSQSVSSFDESTDGAVAAMTDALNQCPEFTSIDADGVLTDFTAVPLSFPNVGDSTVAVRLNATAEEFDLAFDVVLVSIGNNGMTFVAGGLMPMDGAQLEQLAITGVSRMAAAAQS